MAKKMILNYMQKPQYVVPSDLIKYRSEIGLDYNGLLIVIYLINQTIPILYNPAKIAKDINLDSKIIMTVIHDLQEKNLLTFDIIVNKSNKKEEYLNVASLYEKLSDLHIEDNQEVDAKNLFEIFEKEFARTLSPIEYEIINSWIESKMSQELIIAALKEAVFNGVNNLRYIDKILYEWGKVGYKKPEDIKRKKPEIKKEELFEYNWLEE